MLKERVGTRLPIGRLEEIVQATEINQREIQRRMQFAERYQDETSVLTLRTWDEFVNPKGEEGESAGAAHVSHNAGDNEWFTPPEYIEAAVEVMGAIDLDPASSVEANEIVGASKFFTAAAMGHHSIGLDVADRHRALRVLHGCRHRRPLAYRPNQRIHRSHSVRRHW